MDGNSGTGISLGNRRLDASQFQFSYSSLNKLLNFPHIFHKEYVLGEKEISTEKYLLEGHLIHYLLLDNVGFDSKYIIAGDKLPSSNNIAIAEYVFKNGDPGSSLEDNEDLILEYLIEVNLHQSLKLDSARVAKILESKTIDYFNFLKEKEGRIIIDSEILDKCKLRVEIIKEDVEVCKLLGLDSYKDNYFDVQCEYLYEISPGSFRDYPFGIKGILDNVTIGGDENNIVITINDFKTTSKGLNNFPETVEFYRYWLQAAFYCTLMEDVAKTQALKNFKIEFNFVVFDKFNQLYVFPVKQETLKAWSDEFTNMLKKGMYHLDSNDYTLPYDFAHKLVYL